MSTAKIAITLDKKLLQRLDQLVDTQKYPSRSRAIQEAVQEKMERLDHNRLARECAKLDPTVEQELAEEGVEGDLEAWPEYYEGIFVGQT